MTIVIEYMGYDLKKHTAKLADWRICELGTYRTDATFEFIVKKIAEQMGNSIAEISNMYYEG